MMKKITSICRVALVAMAAIVSLGVVNAQNQMPKADDLLRQVRRGLTAAPNADIKGYMSKQRGAKINYSMSLRGDLIVIQYFINNAWERFDMNFKDNSLDITKLQGGKMVKLSDKDYASAIAGTDISYEDLSMRFLYWKNGKVMAEKSVVKGRNCYVLELKNPTPNVGNYAWVRVWIGIDDGALWQVHGYNRNGDLIKTFLLNSITKQKDGSWFFKEIKLEVRDPSRNKVISYSTITKTN